MQRTSYGSGLFEQGVNRTVSVRKSLFERRHFVGETQSLSNRQATTDGEPPSLLRSSGINILRVTGGAPASDAAWALV